MATRDLTVFAVLAAMMFLTRWMMQMIPNVHLLGLFIAATTICYRTRALIPLYAWIALEGVFAGFSFWWIPYLYVWLPLWGMFMLAGRTRLPAKIKTPLFMVLSALHGLSFGLLYAPAQALMFGFGFRAMIAWIIAGIPFDLMHAASNFATGVLIVPLSLLLKRLDSGQMRLGE